MPDEHEARVTWSAAHVRAGLPAFTQAVDPAWFDGDRPGRDEGWSLACRFDAPPREQGNPSRAWVRLAVAHAPHGSLGPGVRLWLFEPATQRLALVEVLS